VSASRLMIPVLRILFLILFLLAWEYVAGGLWADAIFSRALVAPPSAVLVDLYEYVTSGLFRIDAWATLSAAALGLFFGVTLGIVVGISFGYMPRVAAFFEPLMVAMNSLPRITLAPLLLMWFGLGLTSKVLLSIITVFFIVFFNAFLGVRSVDDDLIKATRVMGADRWQLARIVVAPSVASWIFAALRTTVSFGVTAVVVGEFVGASRGLGFRLNLSAGVLNTPRVFAIMIVLMIVGISLVEIARRAEKRVLRWRPPVTTET